MNRDAYIHVGQEDVNTMSPQAEKFVMSWKIYTLFESLKFKCE